MTPLLPPRPLHRWRPRVPSPVPPPSSAVLFPPSSFSGVPNAPYPTSLTKARSDLGLDKFIEMFKKVEINILLLDTIRDMPGCAKFLKDTLPHKKKTASLKELTCPKSVARWYKKTTSEAKRSGESHNCLHHWKSDFWDLGVIINLMSLSIFNRFKIGEIKPASIAV